LLNDLYTLLYARAFFSVSVGAAILFDKFWLVREAFRATWQCVWLLKVGYKILLISPFNKKHNMI